MQTEAQAAGQSEGLVGTAELGVPVAHPGRHDYLGVTADPVLEREAGPVGVCQSSVHR